MSEPVYFANACVRTKARSHNQFLSVNVVELILVVKLDVVKVDQVTDQRFDCRIKLLCVVV